MAHDNSGIRSKHELANTQSYMLQRLPMLREGTGSPELYNAGNVTYNDRGKYRKLEGSRGLAGESFSTGDVLLEIETDKAQMDVEAQDDGKMAKITKQAGSKGIKVGTPIAVLAETDDDLSALSLPAEESYPTQEPQESSKPNVGAPESSESQPEAPPSLGTEESQKRSKPSLPSTTSGKSRKQRYPLYPSIAQLLHENGLSSSEADIIPASGPKGRLLKGDVLGYLGKISSSYSSEQSTRITRLGHLDLSNVKPAQPAPPKAMSASQENETQIPNAPEPQVELTDIEIAIPVSLSSVISVQKRIQATLGITLPLSTFIARATDLANHDLPRLAATRPSADDLFNDILGLDKTRLKAPRGRYLPQITALPVKPSTQKAEPRRQSDIYDILATEYSHSIPTGDIRTLPPDSKGDLHTGDLTNLFSVSAEKGKEKQARVFLERVKTFLQVEPGRLIL